MLVFIDESGCPGFKIARGSDPVFAIAMVQFKSGADALATESVVRELHRTIPHKPEFKFSSASRDVRDQFFAAVASCPFDVYAVVVRKELIYSSHLRTDEDAFYNYFLRLLVDSGVPLTDARIRLDGSGGREFERALKSYLRRNLVSTVRDLRMVDSERDQLAQLADMCVGAVARKYREGRADRTRWHSMLAPRIENVWPFR
ncbi:MAG: DUF3800 domain-containing protein [Vicinamibacterales bacterium]